MKQTITLPAYYLAIFDGEDDQGAGGKDSGQSGGQNNSQNDGNAGGQSNGGGSQNDGQRGGQSPGGTNADNRNDSRQNGNDSGSRNDGGSRQDDYDRNRVRGADGRYESRDEYEQRIRTLNQENADRRRENRELKTTLDVVQRRAIRADVLEAVRAAKPFSENAATRIADMFMADMGDTIKLDSKTGQTVGLDKLADWKKSNPDFFKADDARNDGSQDNGAQNDGKGAADGKDGKRGNATSAGTSQGSNSGTGENTDGLPDLSKLKTPAERKAAIDAWKRGLNGSGAGGGYGRASSRR